MFFFYDCFISRLVNTFDFKGSFLNRTVNSQGGHQAAGLCVAIVFGIGGGALVGELGGDESLS